MSAPRGRSKVVKLAKKRLADLGFRYCGRDGRSHHLFRTADGHVVRLAAPPAPVLPAVPPTSLGDCPAYRAAAEERSALRAERDEARAAVLELEAVMMSPKACAARGPARVETELLAARAKLEAADRALAAHQSTYDSARRRAAADICRAHRPAHRLLLRRVAAALTELSDAVTEEKSLRNGLAGVAVDSIIVTPPGLAIGDRRDGSSPAHYWLAWARREGLLDADPPDIAAAE